MVRVSAARFRVAPPLKRPAACASVTVPATLEPAGATALSRTTTGSANDAWNRSPTLLVFEPTALLRRTVSTVPAGITTGFGGGGGGGASATGAGLAAGWLARSFGDGA